MARSWVQLRQDIKHPKEAQLELLNTVQLRILSLHQGCNAGILDPIYNPMIHRAIDRFDYRQLGATDVVNQTDHTGPIQDVIIEMSGGGVDFSFECIGNIDVMRSALECCHKGWGESVIIGVAGAGEEICTRPFQLVTGRVWRGSAFGGVKGRTELPGYVQRYLDGEYELDTFITHTFGLDDINKAFDLMHAGESIRTVINFK